MNLGKKLATLINATLRSGFSRVGSRPEAPSAGGDPAADRNQQLEQVRQAIEAVAAQEAAVARKLATTRQQAQAAADRGDRQAEQAQNRLAAELEAHLKTQTTQSAALAQQLDTLQQALDSQAGGPAAAENPARPQDDEDLAGRKSRLSG